MRRRVLSAVVGLAVAAAVAAPASAAVADQRSDGLWYFDDFHVQDAHDAGLDGTGVTIGLIDSGIDLGIRTLQGADIDVAPQTLCSEHLGSADTQDALHPDGPTADHGTAVASMLVGNGVGLTGELGTKGVAPGAAIRFYAIDAHPIEDACGGDPEAVGDAVALGIEHLVAEGVDVISVSAIVPQTADLEDALVDAFAARIPVLTGMPNEGDLPGWSNMNSLVGVQAVHPDVSLEGAVPTADVDVAAPGFGLLTPLWDDAKGWQDAISGGTSFATPITAGFLAVVAQKYPDATPWQLLQSLARNTGVDDHEPSRDANYGFGLVSLTHMLRNDPRTYPDEHPFVDDAGSAVGPSTERLLAGPAPADGPSAAAPGGASDAHDGQERAGSPSGLLLPVLIGAVVLGLAVLIGVVVTVILVVRRGRRRLPTVQ